MNFLEIFPIQLTAAMKAAGYTQLALAKETGIKQSAISTYCKGKGLPGVESLYAIAQALNVSMEMLLVGENQSSDTSRQMAEMSKKLEAMKEALPLISKANAILSKNV